MINATELTTCNPCPWWCELRPGHAYDDEVIEPDRTHRRRIGRVTITQIESLEICDDGVRTLYSETLAFVDQWDLDADEAESLGRDLIEAARVLRADS